MIAGLSPKAAEELMQRRAALMARAPYDATLYDDVTRLDDDINEMSRIAVKFGLVLMLGQPSLLPVECANCGKVFAPVVTKRGFLSRSIVCSNNCAVAMSWRKLSPEVRRERTRRYKRR